VHDLHKENSKPSPSYDCISLRAEEEGVNMWRIAFVPIIFALSTAALLYFVASLPEVKREEPAHNADEDVIISDFDPDEEQPDDIRTYLKFPKDLEELRQLSFALTDYKDEFFTHVFILFCLAYVYKQTFSIPGSVFLNLLAGHLFGISIAFPLVCLLTACGASFAFLLSRFFASSFVQSFFPEQVVNLRQRISIEEKKGSLIYFLLFLRLFPASPNWLLNILSPLAGVHIIYFFPTVALGLIPYNFVCVQTGCLLSELTSMDEVFTPTMMIRLGGVSVVALTLALLKRSRTAHLAAE